jgi:hypothetical protein
MRLPALSFALAVASFGCMSPDSGPTDQAGLGGKADDGSQRPLLTCTQSETLPEAKLKGSLLIYDLGLAESAPTDNLPSTVDFVIGDGFPLKAYRVTYSLAVKRGAYKAVDTTYYGNLYQGGGTLGANLDENLSGYDISNYDGKMRLTVRYEEGADVGLPLSCEGTLPTEDEARGPNADGLALDFDCTGAAITGHPAVPFSFGLKRIDRPESIAFSSGGENDLPIAADENSEVYQLNENYSVGRTARRIVIKGDSDGFAYTELKLTVPQAPGDTVAGTFTYTCADGCAGDHSSDYRQSVSCKTKAP